MGDAHHLAMVLGNQARERDLVAGGGKFDIRRHARATDCDLAHNR
jgi:hypothetical protein